MVNYERAEVFIACSPAYVVATYLAQLLPCEAPQKEGESHVAGEGSPTA